jgi:hypothetical protein
MAGVCARDDDRKVRHQILFPGVSAPPYDASPVKIIFLSFVLLGINIKGKIGSNKQGNFPKEQTRGDPGAQSHGAVKRPAGPPKKIPHKTPLFGQRWGFFV